MSKGHREEDNLMNKRGREEDCEKFLKVTPNLFTPGRLHLFDSLDLYTSLIKCSKSIEQGERLHNLSWRIVNKALLKDNDINKSKKRDGLKNLYYVLNPIANRRPLGQPQSQAASESSTPGLRSPSGAAKPAVPRMEPLAKRETTGASSKLSHSGKDSLFANVKQHKSTSALSHIQRTASHSSRKEEPQVIVRGFDPSTVITSRKAKEEATGKRPGERARNTFYIEATPPPEPDRNSTSTLASRKALPSRQESLFGKPKTSENAAPSSRRNSLFFSSEEEEEEDSDWDEDSPFYDEEEEAYDHDDDEEDQYYRRQWDKLLFAKNTSSKPSSNATPNSASSNDPIKRSLLSGLFLNEQVNGNNRSAAASPAAPTITTANGAASTPYRVVSTGTHAGNRAVFGTSNVNAVGSVTPPDKRLPEALYEEAKRSSRGSFSSIVSEQTRERYTGESNAPPAAQTILPTALSTHMFLPNNVHQQRLAMAAAAGTHSRPSSAYGPTRKTTRRESIDIPSKNKNNSFIKTRMEISKEEDLVRAYSRRNL
ncbi:hypothetical protein HG536_0B02780 [Torulaspora globosa]|uniref:Nitrogen regulatory protein areA GATA-like domain-containing protein n=1 Tax=Torulaspora globosa TaxID=48254 RepID=A0A7G3ZD29_9SACH|nr:uncharacterized protein HG536_0B02780 [Torulaspora globosa]QLL31415.1 hypothetical protein HG536_0B02780 [Torulaspora globosa]